jgi:hypothetical protein
VIQKVCSGRVARLPWLNGEEQWNADQTLIESIVNGKRCVCCPARQLFAELLRERLGLPEPRLDVLKRLRSLHGSVANKRSYPAFPRGAGSGTQYSPTKGCGTSEEMKTTCPLAGGFYPAGACSAVFASLADYDIYCFAADTARARLRQFTMRSGHMAVSGYRRLNAPF